MRRACSITFVYLGRGLAFSAFVRELASAASREPGVTFEVMVADRTELADRLEQTGAPVVRIATFDRVTPIRIVRGFFSARRAMVEHISARRPDAVVTLMPHVWSPLLTPRLKGLGIHYGTIVHDATPHPGDPTAWATSWLLRDADHADTVFTLSQAVADELAERSTAIERRTRQLFHPDLLVGGRPGRRSFDRSRPLRLLFFGRIMAYKGLAVLVEAVEILRREGLPVSFGVAGRGALDELLPRLEALGAEVKSGWLSDAEVADVLSRYDVMACSHVEASQSGVAALAFGNAMPVIAAPVGGIAEQVIDGRTGVIAERVSPEAFAAAIRRLAVEPQLYETISANLAATHAERSMSRFVREIVETVVAERVRVG